MKLLARLTESVVCLAQQTLEATNWDELVLNTIKDNKPLQEEFVQLVADYNDLPAAAKWAVRFGLEPAKLSDNVQREVIQRIAR